MSKKSYLTDRGESKKDVLDTFNKALKDLVNKVYILSKKSIKAESLKNQLSIVIRDDPETIIKDAGPAICEHKTQIEKYSQDPGNDNFWSEIDFEKKWGHTENMKKYMDLFNLVKTQWPDLSIEEKKSVGKLVQTLLDRYIVYTIFIKVESGTLKAENVGFTTK